MLSSMNIVQLRKELRLRLPPRAYAPARVKLAYIGAFLALLVALYSVAGAIDSLPLTLFAALVIAHTHLTLGILGHELGHRTIVRSRKLAYWVSVVLWAADAMHATVWDVSHNIVHHRHTNAVKDSFRYFVENERNAWRTAVALFLFPNRHLKYSPTPLLLPMVYNASYFAGGLLLREERALPYMTNIGFYSRRAKLQLVMETFVMGGWQLMIFLLVRGNLFNYFVLGPFALLLASVMTSLYIFTQHGLHPVSEDGQPLAATSLRLPRWIDALHFNNSYHIEHHLLPNVNSKYYPLVLSYLETGVPGYQRLGLFEVWRRMMKNPLYKKNAVTL